MVSNILKESEIIILITGNKKKPRFSRASVHKCVYWNKLFFEKSGNAMGVALNEIQSGT